MPKRTKFGILLAGVLLLIAVLPTAASACGGLFCTNVPIDQNGERIIFTVDSEAGLVSAIIGINYVGAAEDFSWILPVPSVPEIDVAPQESLDFLEVTTAPRFNAPRFSCSMLYGYLGRGGGGGDFFVEEGTVGPFDFAILGSEDPSEVINWLRGNNYRITEEMEPLIAVYVEEENLFIAMKLNQASDVGDIQPVVITYQSEKPAIPIRLTAVAAQPNMPVLTWIFADTRYEAENFANPVPDFSGFRVQHQVNGIGNPGSLFIGPPSGQYRQQQSLIQETYNGLAFITEYAQPSANITDPAASDPLIQQLMAQYPYVTRLRAQMSPEQMTLDPVFAPVSGDVAHVSNVVDLGEYVDPLEYWGCSTRTALSAETINNLPEGRTYIDTMQLSLAHPEDWLLTEISIDGEPLWVYAPQVVDADIIKVFLNGQATPPMFVFAEIFSFDNRGDDGGNRVRRTIRSALGLEEDAEIPHLLSRETGNRISTRFAPYGDELYDETGISFVMLADEAAWETDGAMFDAMLRYARSYQFYRHPELQHTLFLDFQNQFPYPDGWIEHTLSDDEIVIAPKESVNPLDGPYVRLVKASSVRDAGGDLGTWIETEFGFPGEDFSVFEPTAFDHNGRMGYVRGMEDFIMDFSAPTEDFADFDPLLTLMLSRVFGSVG